MKNNNKDKANNVFSISAIILTFVGIAIFALMFIFSDELALMLGASKDVNNLLAPTSGYLKGLAIGTPFQLGVLFLIPFMHIDGDKKRIALSVNVMLITNLVGDIIVALLFNGNIFGMALTTSISCFCAFAILMLHFKNDSVIKLKIKGICFNDISQVSQYGIIPAITRSFSMIRSYILNIIIISLAGTGILAANSLVQSNIKIVPVCVATAIGSTTVALASSLYAQKDSRGIKEIFISSLKISFGPCLLIAVLTFIFSKQIAMLFGAGETAALTAQALRCFIIGLPIIGIKMFYIYYFQASGNKKLSYYSSVAGEFVFLVCSAYIMIKLLGTMGLWLCYPVSELIYVISIFIIAVIKLKRIPRCIDDFLFLGNEFKDDNIKIYDKSIHRLKETQMLSEEASEFCKSNNIDSKRSMYVGLVVEEIVSNVFEHSRDNKEHFVDLKISIENNTVRIRLRDDGKAFNPKERIEMLDDNSPEHNIGLRIVSKTAKDMDYISILKLNQFLIEL